MNRDKSNKIEHNYDFIMYKSQLKVKVKWMNSIKSQSGTEEVSF